MGMLSGSYNGLSWSKTGTVKARALRGFDDLPLVISRDKPKVLGDGLFAGQDLLGEWVVSVTLVVALVNSTDSAFRTAVDSVNSAFSRQNTPLPLRWWNLERYVYARPRSRTWSDQDSQWCDHTAVVTVSLVVADATAYVGTPP